MSVLVDWREDGGGGKKGAIHNNDRVCLYAHMNVLPIT